MNCTFQKNNADAKRFIDASGGDSGNGGFPIWIVAVVSIAAVGGVFFFVQKNV
ncbi:hypothetical protein TALC_00664 [Thermoplasmatales archaeon BRNA1]|nr:hypothetical protein TALC_00664 [Thermoplasmatales archaeon BRNA1]